MASFVQIGILHVAYDMVTTHVPVPLDRWAVLPETVSIDVGDGVQTLSGVVSPSGVSTKGLAWSVSVAGDVGIVVRFDGSAADSEGFLVPPGATREFRVTHSAVSPSIIPVADL